MERINVGKDKVFIGRLGDNDVREFGFDISEWAKYLDNYSVRCVFVLPSSDDAHAYPIARDKYWLEGTNLIWIPTRTECSETGYGKFEAKLYNEQDQEISTMIWGVQTGKSLYGNETPPEEWENYILAIERLVDEIESMTVSASVDANVGTPSVEVETSGGQGEPFSIDLAFHNLKGETGSTGATPQISVTATTLPEGSSATATISGTAEAPLITFGIPVGATGKGIASVVISKTGTSGLVDTYTWTMTYDNGDTDTGTFTLTNGNGIKKVELYSTSGLAKTYRITYDNGNHFDYVVTDGNGITNVTLNADYTLTITTNTGSYTTTAVRGEQGNGIVSIYKTGTAGLVDTYTILYDDGNTDTFDVTNGEGQSGTALPLMDGTATVGTSTKWSHEDHVHPHDVSLLPTDSVNGNPISISDGFPVNAKGLSVALEPIQDLHGYESPWPAGGGKNLLDIDKATVNTLQPYGFTISRSGDTVTVSGTSTSSGNLSFNLLTNYADDSLSGKGYTTQVFDVTSGYVIVSAWGFRTESERSFAIRLDGITLGQEVNVSMKLSVSATSQTAWSPYSNICPISGHSEVSVVRTDGDGQQSLSLTIPLGQTVYGGTVDVTNGVLTVTHMMFERNSSTMNNADNYPGWRNVDVRGIVGTGLSKTYTNMYLNIGTKFAVNTLGTNDILYLSPNDYKMNQTEWQALAIDVQIVIPLAIPITVTLTPQTLALLLGDNVITSDGTITLDYYCDVTKYIAKKIAEVQALILS